MTRRDIALGLVAVVVLGVYAVWPSDPNHVAAVDVVSNAGVHTPAPDSRLVPRIQGIVP